MNRAGVAIMCIGACVAFVGLLSLLDVPRFPDEPAGAHPVETPVGQRPLNRMQDSRIHVPPRAIKPEGMDYIVLE